ncbi:flagellar hook-associated protein FlgK [Xinfangfangia sp. CPCC 101601]|uniref:Flagellar hook-associated protein 1 n=1 Tax=Pseudogemmobacter lacusdianii TaxID=3069608 RepID=A0ABU0VUC3_9RHOB|nr:flagellar hook-associated protein FlgK [Xinfangfangia sp. CPCC 101601]MDQ2065334.1 flagellar hook-associated protein FlgK [Xinfangfangia sp. CPCC 101601]
MSITTALASALTGLSANARQAAALSSNVANAATPGYGRREVSLSALALGGVGQGVMVNGVTRAVDGFLLADRRLAQASSGDRDQRANFLKQMEHIIGVPTEAGSLTARVAAFDTALMEAASRPDSVARLSTAVDAARYLVQGLNQASEAVQAERLRADGEIAKTINDLNGALRQVSDLNVQIRTLDASGRDASALMDQRQQIVDRIATVVPLRELPRDHGGIALMTTGGAVLLDGSPAQFGFTGVNTLVPEMTQASGGLSGLTLNGKPMPTAGETSLILGGALGAMFAVRDELAVQGQARLDGMARDLVERFSAGGLDPSLIPGAPGLFTDSAASFDPLQEIGLSGRIALNTAVDPQAGGEVWRLRDGLGATAPGPMGEARLILALSRALVQPHATSSTAIPAGSRSFADLTADLLSLAGSERLTAQTEQAFSAARYVALDEMERATGVDTDQEMQMLLVLEKNYAANAKVLQVVDGLLATLLEL